MRRCHVVAALAAVIILCLPSLTRAERVRVDATPTVRTISSSGPPTTDCATVGDLVVDSDAVQWYASVQGCPGTWVSVATAAGLAAHLADLVDPHRTLLTLAFGTRTAAIGFDPAGLTYAVSATVQAVIEELDAGLVTVAGAAATAQSTADGAVSDAATAQGDINAHAGRTDNPHGVTTTQVGLDKVTVGLPVGTGAPGTLSNTTLSLATYDAANRDIRVRITGAADSGTAAFAWVWIVPDDFSVWSTTALDVPVVFSDLTGNNAVTLTVVDTAGATVLSAYDLTEVDSYSLEAVPAASLSAGTYTAGGRVSFVLAVTTDSLDTVDAYGVHLHYAR